jgi:hypothetical protein
MGIEIKTTDLPATPAADELLGNQTIDGIKRSVRVPFQAVRDAVAGELRPLITAASEGILPSTGVVRCRTKGNVNLASLVPGFVTDGITLVAGDNVFVPDQASQATNGFYTIQASGAPIRAAFADTAAELARRKFIIREGTEHALERWVMPLAENEIVLGTTPLIFAFDGKDLAAADTTSAVVALGARVTTAETTVAVLDATDRPSPRAIIGGRVIDRWLTDAAGRVVEDVDIAGRSRRYAALTDDTAVETEEQLSPRALINFNGRTVVADRWLTADGRVTEIITADGQLITTGAVIGAGNPDIVEIGGNIEVFDSAGGYTLSARTGAQGAVTEDAAAIRWRRVVGGLRSTVAMPKMFSSALGPTITKLTAFVLWGQSLQVGTNAFRKSDNAVLNAAPVLPGRAVTFDLGCRILGSNFYNPVDANPVASYAELGNFINLQERFNPGAGETIASQMALRLGPNIPASEGLLFINVAIGSASTAQMTDGKPVVSNIANALGRAAFMCRQLGIALEVGGLVMDHGHADSALSRAAYKAGADVVHDAFQQIARSVTGQASAPVYVVQCGMGTGGTVALAQFDMTRDATRNYVGVTPSYPFPNTSEQLAIDGWGTDANADTTHMGATGMARKGDYVGRAVLTQRAGQVHEMLRVVSVASIAGATVTLNLNINAANMVMPIAFGTGVVANLPDGRFGVRYSHPSGRTLAGVAINGSNQLVLTLSAATAADGQNVVTFGAGTTTGFIQGPQLGDRCSIRDSRSTSPITLAGTQYFPTNWMAIHDFTF